MMKTIYITLVALSSMLFAQAQNYVTIPDSNFVKYLTKTIPSAMNGNKMDINSSAVKNLTVIDVENLKIADITGVEYFSSLITLDCGNGQTPTTPNVITSLPTLPQSLQELDCSNNKLTSLPALPNTMIHLSCAHNNITQLPTLPSSLLVLFCEYNKLTSIPTLPQQLVTLWCFMNQLTGLPQLPGTLRNLACHWCKITSLPSLPNSLLNLECFWNELTSLPALPASLKLLNCYGNKLTTLPSLPNSLTELGCGLNQLTKLPELPNSLTKIETMENQITTISQLPASLLYLDCSYNQITSLPTLPKNVNTLLCFSNKLTSLPSLPHNITYLNCSNNKISCFSVFPKSLTDTSSCFILGNPFTCLPNYVKGMNAQTLAYPLCMNGDTVANKQGCADAGKGIIGFIYKDNNNDCKKEITDLNMKNVSVKLFDKNNAFVSQTYSAINGVFDFPVDTDKYTVVVDTIGVPFILFCKGGTSSTVTLTTAKPMVDSVNFGFTCKPGFDLGTNSSIVYGIPFPGLQHELRVFSGDMSNWYNMHCASGISGEVLITVSGPITYNGIAKGSLTPKVKNNVYTYAIADFGTIDSRKAFGLLFTINDTAKAGDDICVHIEITPIVGDNLPKNNIFDFCYKVVNSHDPNNKEVYPVNVEPSYNGYFTYTVHFQNTGNAAAQNIRVVDTLSSNLDLSTFQMIGYSNNNATSLDNSILTVRFPNIKLPDSASNPAGSIGYFQYRIKPKANHLPTATIKNTAHIYFDFNAPIATNTTINNFNKILAFSQIKNDESIILFPNPAKSTFTINAINKAMVEIYNLNSQLMVTISANGNEPISLKDIPVGIYFVKIINDSGVVIKRLLVE